MVFDWHLALGILAGLLSMFSVIPYIKDIIHGTTRPNIVSWALWVLLLLISISAQVSAGTSWSIILLIGDLIGTSAILAVSLSGYGYKKYGWVEWTCLALAFIAIISWQLTDRPLLAIVFAIIADSMASIPTIVKAYKDPWSEHSSTWLIIAGSTLLAVASTTIFNLENTLFPIYLFVVNGTIGSLTFFGRRLKQKY